MYSGTSKLSHLHSICVLYTQRGSKLRLAREAGAQVKYGHLSTEETATTITDKVRCNNVVRIGDSRQAHVEDLFSSISKPRPIILKMR